ncbi:MBL fold metallo-hydrolase [Congregibacter sp.]|uniref:MBL fold metallo-hydrolase n=1 Tax=Congregibacter sp. TaxID=2744308 RepID=UPI003F6AABBA
MLLGLSPFAVGADLSAQVCPSESGVAVQVLGSGGPIADDARASSAYLVWVDGRARVLVDIGGGAVLRFAESGASFGDLDAILLSHFHADHSAGLPALLKSGYFANRERALTVAGPSSGGNSKVYFPSLDEYMTSLLKSGSGAYGYLGDYLEAGDARPLLRLSTVPAQTEGPQRIAIDEAQSKVAVYAMAVSHGPVPAVAYRIEVHDRALVFAGDQDGTSRAFVEFAAGADLLTLHMPIPEGAGQAARALHATPSRLGEIARAAKAKQVLLSHFMGRSLASLEANVAHVKSGFSGPVERAEDLGCVAVD